MSLRAKLISLWFAALLSPLVAGYALLSAITYVWFNANSSWSNERASLWAWSALTFFCLFAVMAVVAIVRLVRYYNSLPRLPDREEVSSQ
jgi:MFS family permease